MKFKKNIFKVIISLAILLLISLAFCSSISAATWQVKSSDGGGGMGNNEYIQNIITNKASKGDTIIFKDASYNHIHLTIDKPLNIVSNSGTKIYTCPQEIANGSDERVPFVVTNKGSGTKITGLNIINYHDNGYGILINSASNINVENNSIESKGSGIKILKSSNANLKNNTIKGAKIGINVLNSKNLKIRNNKVYGNRFGVECSGTNNNVEIASNTISKNRVYGIILQGNGSSNIGFLIRNNNINKNKDSSSKTFDAGICINGTFSKLNISSNMITENGKYGIYLTETASRTNRPIIEYNYLAFNMNIKNDDGYDNREIVWLRSFEKDARHPFKIGYNFYGKERSFASLCASTKTGIILWDFRKTNTKGVYEVYYKKIDDNGKYKGIAKPIISHKLKVYLNYETSKQVVKNAVVKNGIAKVDFRTSTFKTSANKLYLYNVVEKTFSIKNSEIPKKPKNKR